MIFSPVRNEYRDHDSLTCPPMTGLPFPCNFIPMSGGSVFISLLIRIDLVSKDRVSLSATKELIPDY